MKTWATQSGFVGLLGFGLLTGCGTLQTKVRDEQAMQSIRKVAVVAYTATLPASAGLGLNMGTGKLGAEAGGSQISDSSSPTDLMLAEFSQALGKDLGWKVLELSKMKSHPRYIASYDRTMKGFQNKMPIPDGYQAFLTPGVMDKDGPRILDVEGRDALMQELGVDAIVQVDVDVKLEGTTMMGIGSRKPKSYVHVRAFNKGARAPIWFETFEGETSQESVGSTGFIDEKKLKDLALGSARTAYRKLKAQKKS